MLVANDRLEEALRELEALKVLTPKESLVYFLIGKVSDSEALLFYFVSPTEWSHKWPEVAHNDQAKCIVIVYCCISLQVHKKLGNAHASMLNFSWATDLDPKGANNHIKEAIDRRYINDDDEEGEHTSLSLDSSVCK